MGYRSTYTLTRPIICTFDWNLERFNVKSANYHLIVPWGWTVPFVNSPFGWTTSLFFFPSLPFCFSPYSRFWNSGCLCLSVSVCMTPLHILIVLNISQYVRTDALESLNKTRDKWRPKNHWMCIVNTLECHVEQCCGTLWSSIFFPYFFDRHRMENPCTLQNRKIERKEEKKQWKTRIVKINF